MLPGLYIASLPIGNIHDITIRVLKNLALMDLIICEDTRITGYLLNHYDIKIPMKPYHEHNAEKMRPLIIDLLKSGKKIAITSDAGTPLISDPGYKLVREAIDNNITVIPLPGPSAVLTALVASGLPTNRFTFLGFLPTKSIQRKKILTEFASINTTLIIFESAKRLLSLLTDAKNIFEERKIVIARELTKIYEEFKHGNINSLIEYYQNNAAPKGEIVVLIEGNNNENSYDDNQITEALLEEMKNYPASQSTANIAKKFKISKKYVYKIANNLKND